MIYEILIGLGCIEHASAAFVNLSLINLHSYDPFYIFLCRQKNPKTNILLV